MAQCKSISSCDDSPAHRCTRVENPGEGVRDVFAKIPRGVNGFRKNCQGGSTYFAFYCIFINKFSENLPGVGPGGGAVSYPPPPPPPVCIYAPADIMKTSITNPQQLRWFI
jgi:hypothetical protein